ncbi:DNA primase [Rhodobacteraceae bacterium NNCM2]|nr:DNA primase [Coraliihabitans acroporae]
MALPPGFLDDLRSRLTLSDVVGRKVIWDQRKSQPGKGDFWAPCPFHQEKTPSFHVDDRKGFYYCFGCHVKGDMITFVKETENVSFIEAVEILAREAGVEMPAQTRDPRAAERRDLHTRLADAMEQAVHLFGLAFRSGQGQGARDYTVQRGLRPETLKRFEIGFSPNSRSHLTQHFKEKGLLEEAIGAGLVIKPDDGGAPYDRFRGRLMFPIRDQRGRCIAFGGRALSADVQAKYLNSPETELFQKRRVLFNHGPAMEAARHSGSLIVTEGYMDVIALAQAGFDHAVAPLGTAITEEQLALMWRMAPEPIIALDGDAAGLRAANQLIDLALPLLQPGRSLRFCLMPEGKDPDDLIKAGGPEAMRDALDAALPLVEMLWRREAEAEPVDTPERRAALDARLRDVLGKITDTGVRNHYGADLRQRRAELFRPAGRGPGKPALAGGVGGKRGTRFRPPEGATVSARNSSLAASATRSDATRIREAAILLIALVNHRHIAPLEDALEGLHLRTPEYHPIHQGLMAAHFEGTDPIAALSAQLGEDPVALLSRVPQARAHPQASPQADGDRVVKVLAEAISRYEAQMAFEAEQAEAMQDIREATGEDVTWRLRQADLHRQHANQQALEPEGGRSEGKVVSPLQQMLENEAYKRKKKPGPPTNQ